MGQGFFTQISGLGGWRMRELVKQEWCQKGHSNLTAVRRTQPNQYSTSVSIFKPTYLWEITDYGS